MTKHATTVSMMKDLLSDPTKRIALDDFITEHLKKIIDATSPEHFPAQGANVQQSDFNDRVKRYEEAAKDLQYIAILLARWGDKEHIDLLGKIFSRLAENVERESAGLTLWLHLNWYPLQILMYASGISAVAAGKYSVLKVVLETPVQNIATQGRRVPLIVPVAANISDVTDFFKRMPGHEQQYAPRSELMYELSQPIIEELLFLGKSYDEVFDEFEILSALVFSEATGRGWGPIGRYGWKYHQRGETNPYDWIVADAKKQKEKWPVTQAGLFQGSTENFLKLAEEFRERLNKLSWW